jgi:hypothetical protein
MAKTRKSKKAAMTIPELRKAFDHMENFTMHLLSKTKDATARRKAFQKEWMKVFGRAVDDKAANAYLQFESKKKGKTKRQRQRGGTQPLAGAPLDYSTRPGLYAPYGVFPAYVSSGLDFYDKINQQAPVAGCGKEDTTPVLAADMGSNEVGKQKGGKRKTRKGRKQKGGFPSLGDFASSATFRPFAATNPTGAFYDATMAWKGQPLPLSPMPNTANPPYVPYKPTMISSTATSIERDLASEIRTK